MVIDDLKLADVAAMHHHLEELNDDFAAGANKDLALATALRVGDGFEGICKD